MDAIYKLVDWDKKLFLYLNSLHTPWLDPIMLVLSSYYLWVIVALLLVVYAIYSNKAKGRLYAITLLLAIGVNSLVNNMIKVIISRPRPIQVDIWTDIIHAIEEYDSSYSFFSAHSSNSFTLAVFSLLYFRNKYFTAVILIWASAVAYSRIYLAKHYPLDVLTGILFGTMMGMLAYKCFEYYWKKKLNSGI